MVEPANRSVAFRRITELQESDLPMVVRMLQDSQEGWPGGFFAGYTISAEMIRQILEEETPTAVFLSWEGDAVAAFCTVSDWPHDNAAYINLLNSSAHFRGRGHGRDLLRTVIQRCTAQGYDRVDLHTWSGNFRAVPLYKKTGFFWVPDTSVHMQNYLPLLLRVPQLQQFWEEVDPYRDFVRDLSIGEDRMYLGGMLVYIYEFRHGTRFFRAVIDVTARALTALETERWKVSCTVPTRHLAQSVPLTARWEIENHLSAPLPFVLAATGGGGIHVTQETQGSVEHAAQWQATVAAPPDLNIPEPGAEQPGIYSTLFLEGQPLHLRTGLQVYPVVTIRSAPERIQLRPGREREIRLELQNTLQEEITLELQAFTSPGLTVELGTKAPVRILAESVGEVTLGLRAAQNGLGYLELQGSVTRAQGVVSLPPVRLTVAVVDWGQAVWFETLAPRPRFSEDLTQGREVRLETAHQRLVLSTQAGHFSVEDPETNTTQISGRLTFRPPLRWNEQEELRHSVTGVVSGGTGSLRVTTCLPSLPGVVVEHTLTLLGGGILRIDAMVSNGGMAPCDLQLGVSAYGGGEQVTMPLREGLVQDASLEWPDWHDPALFTSERFAEHWLARSDSGQVAGLVWERATLVRPSSDRLGTVRQHLSTLAPGEQRVIGAVYLYGGLGSWQQVRQLWQQRIATKADGAAPIFPRSSVSLLGPHDAPALFTGRPQELRFQSFYARPIQGELTFTVPAGWKIEPSVITVPALTMGTPQTMPATVTRERGTPHAGRYSAALKAERWERRVAEGPLIALMDPAETVRLSREQRDGQEVWTVDNGVLTFAVAPAFAGSVIELCTRDGAQHVLSAFPRARELAWTRPWFGGLGGTVYPPGRAYFGEAGLAAELTFRAREERSEWQTPWPWTGIALECTSLLREVPDVRLELRYLTLPGSHALLLEMVLVNETDAHRAVEAALTGFVQPGGRADNAELLQTAGGSRWRRALRTSKSPAGDWLGIREPDSGITLAFIPSARNAAATLMRYDAGTQGAHGELHCSPTLAPRERYTARLFLVVAQDEAEARAYDGLGAAQLLT